MESEHVIDLFRVNFAAYRCLIGVPKLDGLSAALNAISSSFAQTSPQSRRDFGHDIS